MTQLHGHYGIIIEGILYHYYPEGLAIDPVIID